MQQGMEHISVLKTQKLRPTLGRHCQAGDWVTAHFKTFNGQEEKLEDTEAHQLGLPVSFLIGYYQVPKCWEIALVSLRAGEKIKMRCPPHYAYGGSEKYGHFGHAKIPAWSELIFELSVLECEETPEALDKANKRDHTDATPLMKKSVGGDSVPAGEGDAGKEVSEGAEEALETEEAKVDSLKETLEVQKEAVKGQLDELAAEEATIASSEGSSEEAVDKMMEKEEQIVEERAIIDDEKESIASAEAAIESAKTGVETKAVEPAPKVEATDVNKVDESAAEEQAGKQDAAAVKEIIAEEMAEPKPKHEKGTTLGSLECLDITYTGGKAEDGTEYVLEAAQVDKYHPKKFGVYNVLLAPKASHLSDEEDAKTGKHKLAQQWRYDADTQTLYSRMFPTKALFEGANKNLIVYKYMKLKNQKFIFDLGREALINSETQRAVELSKSSEIGVGANIETAKILDGSFR